MPISKPEVLAWCAIALLFVAIVYGQSGFGLANDSYQYLSEARHISNGQGLQTSIIHFDVERAHGRLPAPLTTFPPGYPLAIAALSFFGIPLETSGVVCSLLAVLALVPLLAFAAGRMQLSGTAARLAIALVSTNAVAATFGTFVMTEAVFTLLSSAALTAVIAAEAAYSSSGQRVVRLLFFSGILAGLAYCTRYAGLFLVGTLGFFHTARALFLGRKEWPGRVLAIGAPLIVMAPVMLRNLAYSGSWKGGNTKAVFNPIAPALGTVKYGLYHSVFGWKQAHWGVGEILVLIGVVTAVFLVIYLFKERRVTANLYPKPVELLLLMYVGLYFLAMVYLSITSVIDVSARTFYPLFPAVGLLAGAAHDRVHALTEKNSRWSQALKTAVVLVIAGYTLANFPSLFNSPRDYPHVELLRRLNEPSAREETAAQWLAAHVPAESTIFSSCGQATGYVLHRNTVSLVNRQYSDEIWNEPHTAAAMERFGSEWLVLYPGAQCAYEQRDSEFLDSLAGGRSASPRFQLALSRPGVVVWKRLSP